MDSKSRFAFPLLAMLLVGTSLRSQEPSVGCLNCEPSDAASAGVQASADSEGVTVQYFQENLPKDGGQWIQSPEAGPAWQPEVPASWRPYTDGQWASTDQGWAWVGNEPWAWATYHYGRWYQDENARWTWVPGNVWAPAWVAWRQGAGYVGWAPLPPTAGLSAEGEIDLGRVEIAANWFSFVPTRSLLAPRLSVIVMPVEQNVAVFRRTGDITRFSYAGGRVVNAGVSVESIERAVGRPIRRFQVAAVQGGHLGGRPSGSQLSFVQPPALVHAARVSHGEFGRALERQSAARRARFAAAPASGNDRSHSHGATERTTQSSSYGTRSTTGTGARTSEVRDRPHRGDADSTGSSHSAVGGVGGFNGGRAGDSGAAVRGFGSGRGRDSGSSSSGSGGSGSGNASGAGSSPASGSGSSHEAKPSGGSSSARDGQSSRRQPKKPAADSDKHQKPPASS